MYFAKVIILIGTYKSMSSLSHKYGLKYTTSMAQSRCPPPPPPPPPCLSFSNCGFSLSLHYGFSLKCCGVQFLGKAHADLFTQLSSNKFCSTVTHIGPSQDLLSYNTCLVSPHAQAEEWQQRESVVGVIQKNAFFASCISSAHVAVELESIFASSKH